MSYYCDYIPPEKKGEWELLVASHPAGGFHQSFGWSAFKKQDGWETYKIGLYESENGKLAGGACVYGFSFENGTNFLYIPEGPILNYSDAEELLRQWRVFFDALLDLVSDSKKIKTTHIRFEPRLDQAPAWFLKQFQKAPLNLQPMHTQVIDLTKSMDQLLAEMKPKGRYNLGLSQRKVVVVRELKASESDAFYELYRQTFERQQFAGKPKSFFENYQKTFGEYSKMFIAEYKNQPLAVAIIVYFGSRATYFYGGSTRDHSKLMGPYALHWNIMEDAKKKGFSEYDLWGINWTPDDPSHEWYGLTRFKKQLGGSQLDLIGAYDYILQKNLYKEFIGLHESA